MNAIKEIHIRYYALLREQRGCSHETIQTDAQTPLELYTYLRQQHRFTLDTNLLRVSLNNSFESWDSPLHDKDTVVFIPPVAGG